MSTFEITIQRKDRDRNTWPVVARHQPGAYELALWSRGQLELEPGDLHPLLPSRKETGLLLGKALFQEEIRDAFVRSVAEAKAADEPLRVLLNIEADDLRRLHWEQLCAPLDRGWDYLLLNQGTPLSLYLPSQIERRFPPIGRRDLRALILAAGPEDLGESYDLAAFDVPTTVSGIQAALGEIPSEVLAQMDGAVGLPTLDSLCERLTAGHPTLLHIVCHGVYRQDSGETILYFPSQEGGSPVPARELIERLGRLDHLPYLTFLSTCESAAPRAETGLGGLGQRLVRKLGMPAVLAMTDRISIATAEALASTFYARLRDHGEVDRALVEALTGLQGRFDVTVPALFSRLGGRTLWTDALDRPLTEAEIGYGLAQMEALLDERASVLKPEFENLAATLQASLGTDPAALSREARREREAALAAANQLCSQALDLSFHGLALGQPPPAYDSRCPFRGLFPFRVEDREFFFGRKALVDKLGGRLMEHGFLAVLGPSGSGKSSLVLAGVVPALQVRFPRLRMAYLTPGSEPLAQLDTALTEAAGGDGASDLVVIDQFEELFTLCRHEGERQTFVDQLLAWSGRSRIVITMRADFWGDCAAFPALKDEMQAHQELVGPMESAALRRAMERQADHVRLRFEDGLGEAILDDVEGEPGAMPLLQHALLLLWQRRHGRWLCWEEYRAIGGIREAIAHTADEVYQGLAGREQARMRDIFLRLTRLEDEPGGAEARDTRRRVRLAELVPAGSSPADTIALIKQLADARLVVTGLNAASGQEEVDVAHEALIRHWPRLRGWLEEDRAELHLREGVREAALEWEANDQEEAYLVHRGGRLDDAVALRRQPRFALNELEQAYIAACVDLRERERREKEEQQRKELEAARTLAAEQAASAAKMRRRALGIGAVGIVAILLAILSTLFWRQAQDNAEIARARELAVLALGQLDENPDLALLLSIEAFRVKGLLQTHQALFTTWSHSPQLSRFLHGHSNRVLGVAWSADGWLASSSCANLDEDGNCTQGGIILWDVESGEPVQVLKGHSGSVRSVAWSVDGRLASGSGDGTVIVWDLERGLPAQTLEGHAAGVSSVAWSVDGRLASGSGDGTVIVWDPERGLPAQTLDGHAGGVSSVAWSADGRLASSAVDGTVIVWDLERGQRVWTLEGHAAGVSPVAWSVDMRLASGSYDGTVTVWDLERGLPAQTLEGHAHGINSVAWSVDGRLASGSQGGTVIVWDLERGLPAQTLEGHAGYVRSVAWSADGRLASGSEDGTVIIWDPERGLPAQTLEGHAGYVRGVAWSADGRLASGSEDHTVIVWDLEGGVPAQTLEGHSESVRSVAWSADGRLASGSSDGTVIIWDLERGVPAQTLEGHSESVLSVAWSADGRLASGSGDGTVIVWDLERGLPAQTLEGHVGWVFSVAWSERDGWLASSAYDGTVIVWDLRRGLPAQTLEGHAGGVSSVAWSADGRLASGAYDSTVIIWDLERGLPAQTLEGHVGWVFSVAWSADGWLAFGSQGGTVQVWMMDPEEWTHQACDRAGRNLTQDEWRLYFLDEEYRTTCDQWPAGE